MKNTVNRLAWAALAAAFLATPATAIESSRTGYAALLAQASNQAKVPASYRIVTDETRQPGKIDAASRYFGGEIRTILVNGRALRLPERDIIENIRSGHFVPVYSETGNRLNRDDWEGSLPHWLGYATREFAAP